MAWSSLKFSYQKLRHEGPFHESDDDDLRNLREKVIGKLGRSRCKKKLCFKKKLKIKIPCISRRLFRGKATLLDVAWNRILKRLKQSRSNFGDLFAGNYLFVQVTPAPLKPQRSFNGNDD